MPRASLVDTVAERVLDGIVRGEHPALELLPSEEELARASGVSRLTVREALKSLRAQNVIAVRRGRGTVVNPAAEWTGMDAILYAATRGPDPDELAARLLEVRRMVEVGAAGLAAARRSDADLGALDAALAEMVRAHAARDAETLARADLAFHDALLAASGNPFVPVLFTRFGGLLGEVRRQTSSILEIQVHAIEHHRAIREAVAAGDAARARAAMSAHLDQTEADFETHFRAPAGEPGDERR